MGEDDFDDDILRPADIPWDVVASCIGAAVSILFLFYIVATGTVPMVH